MNSSPGSSGIFPDEDAIIFPGDSSLAFSGPQGSHSMFPAGVTPPMASPMASSAPSAGRRGGRGARSGNRTGSNGAPMAGTIASSSTPEAGDTPHALAYQYLSNHIQQEMEMLRAQNASLQHRVLMFQRLFQDKERLVSILRTLGMDAHIADSTE